MKWSTVKARCLETQWKLSRSNSKKECVEISEDEAMPRMQLINSCPWQQQAKVERCPIKKALENGENKEVKETRKEVEAEDNRKGVFDTGDTDLEPKGSIMVNEKLMNTIDGRRTDENWEKPNMLRQ